MVRIYFVERLDDSFGRSLVRLGGKWPFSVRKGRPFGSISNVFG